LLSHFPLAAAAAAAAVPAATTELDGRKKE